MSDGDYEVLFHDIFNEDIRVIETFIKKIDGLRKQAENNDEH